MDIQCGVHPGHIAVQTKFSLSSKYEKSLEYAKDVCTCFDKLKIAYDQVPGEKLCEVLPEYGAYCWLSSYCILDQKFVSMLAALNYGCWTQTQLYTVTTALRSPYELDKQSQTS